MKFLVPNYSCLQNPWLRGYRPQIPVLSVLCPQLNLLNPPLTRKKFLGTPLIQCIFCFYSQGTATFICIKYITNFVLTVTSARLFHSVTFISGLFNDVVNRLDCIVSNALNEQETICKKCVCVCVCGDIQGVQGRMDKTSGECSLRWTIPI